MRIGRIDAAVRVIFTTHHERYKIHNCTAAVELFNVYSLVLHYVGIRRETLARSGSRKQLFEELVGTPSIFPRDQSSPRLRVMATQPIVNPVGIPPYNAVHLPTNRDARDLLSRQLTQSLRDGQENLVHRLLFDF